MKQYAPRKCSKCSATGHDHRSCGRAPITPSRQRPKRNRPRSKTIAIKAFTRRAAREINAEYAPELSEIDALRPKTRADCVDGPRPCVFVSCRHHLYLEVSGETGSIKFNFTELMPWELEQTCSLDVADSGIQTLEEVGVVTNLTRERIRQLEVRGLLALSATAVMRDASGACP